MASKQNEDLTGLRFGSWTVLGPFDIYKSPGGATRRRWLCRCDCGKEKPVVTEKLNSGGSKSCGCKSYRNTAKKNPAESEKEPLTEIDIMERSFYGTFDGLNTVFFDGIFRIAKFNIYPGQKDLFVMRCHDKDFFVSLSPSAFFTWSFEEFVLEMMKRMVDFYSTNILHVKSSSRGGYYYNRNFQKEAEKHCLYATYTGSSKGYSCVSPAEKLSEWISDNKDKLHYNGSSQFVSDYKNGGKCSTRKYVCPSCGDSVRATKEVYIRCGKCGVRMKNPAVEDTRPIEKTQQSPKLFGSFSSPFEMLLCDSEESDREESGTRYRCPKCGNGFTARHTVRALCWDCGVPFEQVAVAPEQEPVQDRSGILDTLKSGKSVTFEELLARIA